MIRKEMLKRLDEFVAKYAVDENDEWSGAEKAWVALRTEIQDECCGNCDHWTLVIRVSSKPINPGVCRGWLAGMFSISAEPDNEEVFKTYEDFCCTCFKPRLIKTQETK